MSRAASSPPRSLQSTPVPAHPSRRTDRRRPRRRNAPTDLRGRWLAAAVAVLALLAPVPALADQDRIQWYPAIYEPNPDYIVVVVDLRRLPKNQYLTSVDFDVSFAVPGGAARKETFTFTDAQVARLEAGPVHQRYFRHSQTAVAGVSGGVLRYLVGIEGALPKATRASLPPAAPFRPAGARVIGDVPAARAAGDGQFQDWLGTYDFYEDGLGPVTLRIGRSRRACARPAWCALVVTVTDLRGSEKRMRLDSVDPVRMVFFEDDVSRDARTRRPNWKRYEAYMLRRDKSKLVGIVQFEQAEERFGFYAERRD